MRILQDAGGLEGLLAEFGFVVSEGEVMLVWGREDLVSTLNVPGEGVPRLVLDLPKVVEELRRDRHATGKYPPLPLAKGGSR